MTQVRRLVVNADDFGFTRDVNEGIVEAHRKGILTAATLMAGGDAFEHAVRLAHGNPTLDVGCHLVLVGGHSLLPPYRALPETVADLVAAVTARRLRIYEELAAQIRRIRAAGLAPTHLDTHKHTHLLPPVLDAVARLSREFGIPWVRRPFDFPLNGSSWNVPWLKKATSRGLQFLRKRFHLVLDRYGCRTTDHFAGFQMTGRFHIADLRKLLELLPAGSTEFMCHPGLCGEELRASRTRLKESRQRELEALVAPEVSEAMRAGGIALVNYRKL